MFVDVVVAPRNKSWVSRVVFGEKGEVIEGSGTVLEPLSA
jgi:hypothetical protein